jgi:hypothetical protein
MSILLSYTRWRIRRQNREESSAFLELTSAPHTEAVGFSKFLGISRAIASHVYDYGVTHGLTDWLPAAFNPLTGI